MRRSRILLSLTVALCLGRSSLAAEILGQIVQVQGRSVNITSQSHLRPAVGDRVEVIVPIEGLTQPAVLGTGRVTRVAERLVEATIDDATGEIVPGRRVRMLTKTAALDRSRPPSDGLGPREASVWIGAYWRAMSPGGGANEPPGTLIAGVSPGGPAAEAGLVRGDRIVSVNGDPVATAAALASALSQRASGDEVLLEIVRDGQTKPIEVIVEASPNIGTLARQIRTFAEADEVWAMTQLGLLLELGAGVEQNLAEAARWYRRAHDAQDACATWRLGLLVVEGKGVKKDPPEAVDLLRRAADKGFAPAQAQLGELYQTGKAVTASEVEAARWYRRAADLGFAPAQTRLALLSLQGRGESKNAAAAAVLLTK